MSQHLDGFVDVNLRLPTLIIFVPPLLLGVVNCNPHLESFSLYFSSATNLFPRMLKILYIVFLLLYSGGQEELLK